VVQAVLNASDDDGVEAAVQAAREALLEVAAQSTGEALADLAKSIDTTIKPICDKLLAMVRS
jgi:hypothetical protein